MARIADFLELLAARRRPAPRAPGVRQRSPSRRSGTAASRRPAGRRSRRHLGAMPDYADEAKGGEARRRPRGRAPPRRAASRGATSIVGFGGKPIGTIYDYIESLGRYKPGDTVDVVVKRDGKDVTLKVDLGSRARSRIIELRGVTSRIERRPIPDDVGSVLLSLGERVAGGAGEGRRILHVPRPRSRYGGQPSPSALIGIATTLIRPSRPPSPEGEGIRTRASPCCSRLCSPCS